MTPQKLLLFLLVLLAVLSCGDAGVRRAVERAEELMESSPSEAFAVLDSVRPQAMQTGIGQRSRYILLRQMARHKMWEPIEVDTLLMEAVAYTNRHGSPNERLAANYLLGYGYAENNWTAEAQQAYFRAIESADTTAKDCDFSRLAKTYGQKAKLYNNRANPDLFLEDALKAKYYASKTNDSILIMSTESQIAVAYISKDSLENALDISFKMFKEMLNHGDSVWASYNAKVIAHILIKQDKLNEASEYIRYYEKFNKDNSEYSEKTAGYLDIKGEYFEGKHVLDSALFFFKKMFSLNNPTQKYIASKKISEIYSNINKQDSALFYQNEYIRLYSEEINQYKISQLQDLHVRFDYDHVNHQLEKVEKDKNNFVIIALSLAFALLTLLCSFFIFWVLPSNKRMKLFLQIEIIKNEILILKNKGKASSVLETKLKLEEQKLSDAEVWRISFEKILLREEYKMLKDCLASGVSISSSLKLKLAELVDEFYPVHSHLLKTQNLNEVERLFIILTLFDFRPVDCANLIATSKSNISNYRKSLSKRFFGEDCTSKEFSNRIKFLSKPL